MIRKTEIKDINQIKKLLKNENNFWDKKWRKNVLELGIKSSAGLTFVYIDDKKIVGFICAHDVGFRAYLSELFVDSNFRNKGIGKLLLKKVEDELERRGCKTLITDAWKDSIGFYEQFGWSEPDVKLLRKRL